LGRDIQRIAMGTSLGVAVLMLVGKVVAYNISGSTAILSDAAESVVHIVATGVAALSLWYARQPASKQHPYGHGKVAYFSAGFEGALILSAALYILFVSARALIFGPELRNLGIGLAITAALALVNLMLGLFLVYVGKRQNALILVANGKHVLTDMWTSVGVVGGVAIVWMTGIVWLDPVVAIAAGLNILYMALALIIKSFRGLLDEAEAACSEKLLACLTDAVNNGTIAGYHQLRHRLSNDVLWIELHMLLPGDEALREAHRRVTLVETRIEEEFSGYQVHVTTHIEPYRHHIAHPAGHAGLNDPFIDGE
jgi:cation diffusion facilitator family transporter